MLCPYDNVPPARGAANARGEDPDIVPPRREHSSAPPALKVEERDVKSVAREIGIAPEMLRAFGAGSVPWGKNREPAAGVVPPAGSRAPTPRDRLAAAAAPRPFRRV